MIVVGRRSGVPASSLRAVAGAPRNATILDPTVAVSSAPALARLPNGLTITRFLLVPVFVVLLARAEGGHDWAAGIVFGVAGITDQVDGWLARRWHVESEFGRYADPLADRLMIDVCVVLLVVYDRLPWIALVILLRDLLLVGGYKLVVPRGYEFEVSRLGKVATWGLYASLALVLVTERDTWWPLALFWVSLGLAVVAAGQYVAKALREVRT
jgi:CDP-diacylglycerol--glycerol-3-phosphate 3-phosphatidyltransferase